MLSGPGERENTLVAPTYPDLAGKVAVVTGGSGGIGAATCRMLAANGVKVVVNGRDEAKIGAVVDAIRSAGGEAIGVAADCTDFAAVERLRYSAIPVYHKEEIHVEQTRHPDVFRWRRLQGLALVSRPRSIERSPCRC
jgi:3-oxoacyl-[acyl-carrier protein] reductase